MISLVVKKCPFPWEMNEKSQYGTKEASENHFERLYRKERNDSARKEEKHDVEVSDGNAEVVQNNLQKKVQRKMNDRCYLVEAKEDAMKLLSLVLTHFQTKYHYLAMNSYTAGCMNSSNSKTFVMNHLLPTNIPSCRTIHNLWNFMALFGSKKKEQTSTLLWKTKVIDSTWKRVLRVDISRY